MYQELTKALPTVLKIYFSFVSFVALATWIAYPADWPIIVGLPFIVYTDSYWHEIALFYPWNILKNIGFLAIAVIVLAAYENRKRA